VATLACTSTEPHQNLAIAFSALDAAVAREVEPAFAAAGTLVVSNASAFRMDDDVPLLVPEVNADHLGLLDRQRQRRGWTGGIVANPNCSTAALVLALAPLHRAFGLRRGVVATLQAASGAGYPGVPSLDLLDNVIPHIGGEEEKIEAEVAKLLGSCDATGSAAAALALAAMVHRVPVLDGHLLSASLAFDRQPSVEEAVAVLREFRGNDTVSTLPSSPAHPVEVDERPDRPQPRLDRDRGGGMTVTVGRVRRCPVHHLRLVALGHNLVRGAAGAAIQNAELIAVREGWVKR
jgi:aspartate-semialdehyde dehydrogenase